ncbi:MAG: membrane protein insertase YidC [Christensenellales bacterium]
MAVMTLLSSVTSQWPSGFWPNIIKIFEVGSYAWTIVLFTIVLKLVLSPMDFLQRFFMNRQTRAQAKLQPKLEKLQKQYGQNQNLLYQKQNELMAKSGVNMKASCITMLVYMVLTLTIFITLFNSIRDISGFKIANQYKDLRQTYAVTYDVGYLKDYLNMTDEDIESMYAKSGEERANFLATFEQTKATAEGLTVEQIKAHGEEIKSTAQDNVEARYFEIKDSWLWIKNIWIPDKATTSEIQSYSAYISSTGDKGVLEEDYNNVMGKLQAREKSVNGYYILPILVVAITFLSQWISKKLTTPKDSNGNKIQQPSSGKFLMILMPFMMLLFTLNSSAIFSIYIIVNSIMSTALSPIITIICNKIEDKRERKSVEIAKPDYMR